MCGNGIQHLIAMESDMLHDPSTREEAITSLHPSHEGYGTTLGERCLKPELSREFNIDVALC